MFHSPQHGFGLDQCLQRRIGHRAERQQLLFDYYNVLTDPNNHHRVEGNDVVHTVSGSPEDADAPDELYCYTGTDSHPTAEGHQKATTEYVPLLNAYCHIWQDNTP